MTEKYTPERVAELVAGLREWARRMRESFDSDIAASDARVGESAADALTAVSAERDAAEDGLFRVVQALGFDTDGATDARGFFGPETYHAKGATHTTAPDIAVAYASEHRAEVEAEADRIEAKSDRLHKAIEEALAAAPKLGELRWRNVDRVTGILRAALDKEGQADG